MIFLKPEYFTMMLLPTLVLFYLIASNKSAVELYFDEKVLQRLRFDNDALGKVGRNMLLFAALIMMIVALARPVIEKRDITIASKSIDVMVAFDISQSMLAADIYPSRLAFAKRRFMELVENFKEANIGVIAFSSEGFLLSPMTQDSRMLKYLVHNLSLDSMSLQGTNLFIALQKGKEFLKDAKEKIVIIFTDGGDKSDFSKEIEMAKRYEESIYIYAIGTNKGAPILRNGEALKDKNGDIVITRLNRAIKELAFESGGAYIVGGYEDDSVKLLVKDIKNKFKMRDLKERKVKEYKELFYYPLALALFFMLCAFSSFPMRKMAIMIALVMIAPPKGLEARVFDFFEIEDAKRAYSHGHYKKAEAHYKEVVKSTKSAQSIYDMANAQYRQGKYKEALKSYSDVIAISDTLKYKKAFNQGNAYMQLKEYEKAIEAYERAKKIEDDEDVAYNLALAKKRLEKKKSKKSKKSDRQNEKKKRENQGEGEGKSKSDKSAKREQNRPKEEKQTKQEAQKKEPISQKEEKMWEGQLERMRTQTMPVKFKMQSVERERDEKPW